MKQELTEQQKASLEYNRRLKAGEFKCPEALQGKQVLDVLELPEFIATMGAYMNEQKMTREAVLQQRKKIIESGKYPAPEKRPCIDRVIELGLMKNAEDFTVEFAKVLNKQSKHPAEIRAYIMQLGTRAYKLTVEQLISQANPDMAELLKTANPTT